MRYPSRPLPPAAAGHATDRRAPPNAAEIRREFRREFALGADLYSLPERVAGIMAGQSVELKFRHLRKNFKNAKKT